MCRAVSGYFVVLCFWLLCSVVCRAVSGYFVVLCVGLFLVTL